ncbi:MAG: 5'/3'-nucleotidase SurE [Phycisphaerales bacterium]
MRILLTNDDGIHAPGLVALHGALTGAAEFEGPLTEPQGRDTASRSPRSVVLAIAPLTVQSASSHGVTVHSPLMVSRHRVNERMEGLAVDARPADCVKLAISSLWPEKFGAGSRPDLVISGMNAGANCGINVIYSGTVAAALEAAFLGVPSIAVSLHIGRGRPLFDLAAVHARRAIEAVIAGGLPRPHECLSINIPVTEAPPGPGETWPADEEPRAVYARRDPAVMPPVRVCPMNTHGLVDQYERRVSPAGLEYYWASGHGLDFRATETGSDVDLLLKGHITVTPLWYDLTRHGSLEEWRGRVGGG